MRDLIKLFRADYLLTSRPQKRDADKLKYRTTPARLAQTTPDLTWVNIGAQLGFYQLFNFLNMYLYFIYLLFLYIVCIMRRKKQKSAS